MRKVPILYIVIPCYNEEEVLPITAPLFLEKIHQLVNEGRFLMKAVFYLLMMEAKMVHGN